MGKIRLGMRLPVSMQQFWSFRSKKSKDDQSSDGSPRSVLPRHGELSPLCSAEAHLSLRVSCGRGCRSPGRVHPSVDVCSSPINHKAMDIPHPAVASPRRRVHASGAGSLKGGRLRPKSPKKSADLGAHFAGSGSSNPKMSMLVGWNPCCKKDRVVVEGHKHKIKPKKKGDDSMLEAAWERESAWSVMAEIESQMKKQALNKKKKQKKSKKPSSEKSASPARSSVLGFDSNGSFNCLPLMDDEKSSRNRISTSSADGSCSSCTKGAPEWDEACFDDSDADSFTENHDRLKLRRRKSTSLSEMFKREADFSFDLGSKVSKEQKNVQKHRASVDSSAIDSARRSSAKINLQGRRNHSLPRDDWPFLSGSKFQSFEQYVSSYAPAEKQFTSPSRSHYESDDSFRFDHSNSCAQKQKSTALPCSSDSEQDLKKNVAEKKEMLPTDVSGKVRESIPVRKLSVDPYTDYRESMLEMIMEKELDSLKDLEELLQCYLALNPLEFHDTIIQVFTDLWFEMFDMSS